MSFIDAAGLNIAAETAKRGLNHINGKPGDTLVVNGAAGGVGLAVAQIARAQGMTVIGTASEANHTYLRSLGVTPTTCGPGLIERVRALAPQGVAVAYDAAGDGALPDLIA